MVDEYQDTNVAQYILLRLLTGDRKNICCVGDEDQSIYGWRGAQLKNILNFERDFSDSNIVRLEQNYRSTGNILEAASSLISENQERIGKKLLTTDSSGELVKILNLENDEFKRYLSHQKLKNLIKTAKLSNIAILQEQAFSLKTLKIDF